ECIAVREDREGRDAGTLQACEPIRRHLDELRMQMDVLVPKIVLLVDELPHGSGTVARGPRCDPLIGCASHSVDHCDAHVLTDELLLDEDAGATRLLAEIPRSAELGGSSDADGHPSSRMAVHWLDDDAAVALEKGECRVDG